MATILQAPVHPQQAPSRQVMRDVLPETIRAPRTLAEELLAVFRADGAGTETSFELSSHGGYARTVTGTVDYIDEEAQTLMVRATDGQLARVPLRDVTSAQGKALSDHEEMRSRLGADGLGIGGRARG